MVLAPLVPLGKSMETRLVRGLFYCVLLLVLVGSSTQSRQVQGLTGTGWKKNPTYVLGPGAAASWDNSGVMAPCVIKDGDTYKMWYTGSDGVTLRIGYATSSDGISWTKFGANPVFNVGSPGSWDDQGVLEPWVIKEYGSWYTMWYVGVHGIEYSIGYATSINGISWTRKVDVLSPGYYDDSATIRRPTVIKDGSSYIMWYAGSPDWNVYRIFSAYSGDGLNWVKYDNDLDVAYDFVLSTGTPGSWDYTRVLDPAVLKSGDMYFMWYTGYNPMVGEAIGLAYGTTCNVWSKYGGNPVLTGTGAAWDSPYVRYPCVIQDRLDFKMWYTGNTNSGYAGRRIGYAENFMRMGGAMGLIDAPENTVYYIYPDYQGSKPAGTSYASLSDWTALGMVIGMSSNNQYITTDTDTAVVYHGDGSLAVPGKYSAVICGGRGVCGPVKAYEMTYGYTPAYVDYVAGPSLQFFTRAGTPIAGTAMSTSVVSTNQDMCIIMAFKVPTSGRNVIIMYGYGWKGSYAAALVFKYGAFFGREGIPQRDLSWYVYKWTDGDGDGFVDLSECILVAYGS